MVGDRFVAANNTGVRVMATGPVEVGAACEAALDELAGAFATTAVGGSREEWAAAIGAAQRVVDVATAAQDAAIVRLAAIEPEWLDDGTEVETHRALGHLALDAPSILSGVLSSTAVHAERRVRTAVHLAADGPTGSDTRTGLGGLHGAMAAGRLDAYRAGVIAEELEHAPAEVRACVVAALEQYFDGEDAAHLKRRCRRVLARISPDLLRQRAARARAASTLRRWVDEPGVDKWEGTFPSEEAAEAWAAIDALARQYVADGVCATIDRARAKALTDLVAGHATITTALTVTVPATAVPGLTPPEVPVGDGDLVEVTGPAAGQPVLVSRQWLTTTAESASSVELVPCHPVTGALLDTQTAGRSTAAGGLSEAADEVASATCLDPVASVVAAVAGFGADRYRPSARMARRIRARDRRCRFPGCTVAAVFCDLDHVRPWPRGRTTDDNLLCLCRRHHRVKQRPGWRVTLDPDGTATWTDPTGRVRTTHPVDALHATILTSPSAPAEAATPPVSTSRARTVIPDGPHSELEFLLEHLIAPPPERYGKPPPRPLTSWHDDHGRRQRVELTPRPEVLVLDRIAQPCRRPRRRGRDAFPDEPPF